MIPSPPARHEEDLRHPERIGAQRSAVEEAPAAVGSRRRCLGREREILRHAQNDEALVTSEQTFTSQEDDPW